VAEICGVDNIKLSLMSQYTPEFCKGEYPELKRRVTTFEYNSVVEYAMKLGFDGYIQERSSASSVYTPDFKKGEDI
jgi:putative pyruvate formate lyase activating enzyme